jgi:CBS domain-containing protein
MAGTVFAGLMMALGVIQALAGALGSGLWLMLIGWFLGSAARSSVFSVRVKQALADVPVSRVMQTHFERMAPGKSVDDFVSNHLMQSEQHAWPVESDGRLLGLVVFSDLKKVSQSQWAGTALSGVMTPREKLVTLSPAQTADQALAAMTQNEVDQLPVVDGDKLAGIVRRSDLLKWISLQQQAEAEHRQPPPQLRHLPH